MADTNAARLYERIRADEALTQSLFRQALQDPKGTVNRILALGVEWDLPVSEVAVREHLASLDDDSKQWLIKARGGL
ncbi:hypothetical protein KQ313_08665 [Synechococcus sp. CS-1325]|uniref:hypothetical protein n=1 Tax=unclassified Synechococcus TaxID=2626047 RepID=UPI000DB44F69|nr:MULTISPECIES: hypothetical protein [unclassified Synechococcus]MCT0199747.1 hypothetical protein [Synechococcus sp. CS-1325]MCT0214233.1 hypothetical protein [Synechococcus sp. CS-1326]MCT0232563.1 hypothetical protein [Synechococcus sp. CS-1327]PZV01070.1 MAG: hypothetical protein DCF24_05180 [Cyanobium sp.]